jgi:hypothetical protein
MPNRLISALASIPGSIRLMHIIILETMPRKMFHKNKEPLLRAKHPIINLAIRDLGVLSTLQPTV